MAKLLVVDDGPMTRLTMRSLPEPPDHVVDVVEDGRKELPKFQAWSFDLLSLGAIVRPETLLKMVADCLAAAEHCAAPPKPDRDAISNS